VRRAEGGHSLIELLVVVALAGVVLVAAAPALDRFTRGIELRLAGDEVLGALREARAFAIRHSSKVGVKFLVDGAGTVSWGLYLDGDGDGVRTNDILSGVDPLAAPLRTFDHVGRRVHFGFPPGRPPLDPSNPRRRLDRLEDPIRFNRSDIASFSPLGGSTPGTVYLTDGVRELVAVRVNNRSSRARLIVWLPDERRWREP